MSKLNNFWTELEEAQELGDEPLDRYTFQALAEVFESQIEEFRQAETLIQEVALKKLKSQLAQQNKPRSGRFGFPLTVGSVCTIQFVVTKGE